jgi:hypothetical protein
VSDLKLYSVEVSRVTSPRTHETIQVRTSLHAARSS